MLMEDFIIKVIVCQNLLCSFSYVGILKPLFFKQGDLIIMFTKSKDIKEILGSELKLKRYRSDEKNGKKTDDEVKRTVSEIDKSNEENIKNNKQGNVSEEKLEKNRGFFGWVHNKFKNLKPTKLWDKIHHPFLDENGFKELLINQRELHPGQQIPTQHHISPQAMQGRWQAYGQIRAARIAGRSAILATGLFGAAMTIYWTTVKDNASKLADEVEEKTKIIATKEQELYKRESKFNSKVKEIMQRVSEYRKIAKDSIKILEDYEKQNEDNHALLHSYKKQLEMIDNAAKEACGQDEDCYRRYERAKIMK